MASVREDGAEHHLLTVLVENRPGVLTRVAGLFARRGFNISALAVAATEDPRFSRMAIAVDAASAPLEQVVKQLDKLVNVVRIDELPPGNANEVLLTTLTNPSLASPGSDDPVLSNPTRIS